MTPSQGLLTVPRAAPWRHRQRASLYQPGRPRQASSSRLRSLRLGSLFHENRRGPFCLRRLAENDQDTALSSAARSRSRWAFADLAHACRRGIQPATPRAQTSSGPVTPAHSCAGTRVSRATDPARRPPWISSRVSENKFHPLRGAQLGRRSHEHLSFLPPPGNPGSRPQRAERAGGPGSRG